MQSLADVPLGAFLSGGVDLSTIAALMQQRPRVLSNLIVGFEELDLIGTLAQPWLNTSTDHTEMFVTAAEAQDSQTPSMYDEPFADLENSTHLVC